MSYYFHFYLRFLFFLVTFLHLSSFVFARSQSQSQSQTFDSVDVDVDWKSPRMGDRFEPGDTITAKWQVHSKIVSPSFKLCSASDETSGNSCGPTVWSEVKESAGSYFVSLAAPNVTVESAYYLQMKDDFGHTYSSPVFNLTPSFQNQNIPAAIPPNVAPSQSDQAPMSSTSDSAQDPVPESIQPAASVPAPSLPAPSSAAIPPPYSNAAPGPLALAVPLSLAGAIILLAGGLALHHRRKLAAEKERARERLSRSTSDYVLLAWLWTCAALFAHALFRGGDGYYTRSAAAAAAPPPPPLPPHPFAPTPVPIFDAPEPHQRMRQLDSSLREGFFRPRSHLHLHPHPSSSPYRGIFSDVDTIKRGSSRSSINSVGNSNGSGRSRWRSLSISRSRRQKEGVAPLPHRYRTATASPFDRELTSYDSIGDLEHPSFAGDLGFENVPLSPPAPPPLHIREEATEPDDPRIRELRAVYDAVARALGSVRGS
ncbi:hypothetical protein B0F90DRAFT_1812914 [Multifurca ochricompacta]|uniref:Yeast cell wall synthesis Kre9/Knh1-like N-terminal domain-containing protein n=1 Tax=Multifurca ochricompacta TaxID=376703 RepID=A0AAD4QTA2_9AGAM|nr:hypothetical protein B0F90DRAFT_1812914 [Multifurca ochricompacta]